MSQAARSEKPGRTAKAALLFGSGTLTSRILGLIRDALVLSVMPLDMKDAWTAAFRLPNFFRRLLGEGGLSVSFIPVYVGLMSDKQAPQRQALVDGVYTLLMSVVSLICLICFFFMDPIIRTWLSGSGFTQVPGKIALTIQVAEVMIFFLFFISLFAYFMALLNGMRKFTLSGYAPMLLNIAIIAALLLFKGSEHLALASAGAVVVGGALQALILVPGVWAVGAWPRFTFSVRHPLVKKVMLKFIPTLFGVGVLQILSLLNVYFASQLQPGAMTYIYVADRLLELPLSLIAVSIGTTLLPTLSAYWQASQKEVFMDALARHLSLFYFLALPAAFGLWFMGADIVEILFSRGEFTGSEAVIVGSILKIYGLTLLAAGSLKILNQSLYATGDTLTPALISVFGLSLHIGLAPWLMSHFQIQGLVASTATITVFNLLCSFFVLQKRLGTLTWGPVVRHFFCCLSAATVMGVFLQILSQWSWQQGRFLFDFPILLGLISAASLIYFVVAGFFKVPELQFLLKKLKRHGK